MIGQIDATTLKLTQNAALLTGTQSWQYDYPWFFDPQRRLRYGILDILKAVQAPWAGQPCAPASSCRGRDLSGRGDESGGALLKKCWLVA